MTEIHRTGVAVLASGGGTTFEALVHATQDGRVKNAEVGLVICNNPRGKAGVWDKVDRLNQQYGLDIEIAQINSLMFPGGETDRGVTLEESEAIANLVRMRGVGLVACLGYMKPLNGDAVEEYGWKREYGDHHGIYRARMINTHPGPLPETEDTFGLGASQMVLNKGLPSSRHTVHLVSAGVDEGPIIAANPVEIVRGDSVQDLFDRVQVVEKATLPYIVRDYLVNQAFYNMGLVPPIKR